MIKLFYTLFILSGLNFAQPETGKVIIEVTNFETREGKILLSVYASEEGFPGKEEYAYMKMIVEIGEKTCIKEIDLPPGTYAISLVHDANDNDEADTNFLGIPKEPLGMSNYAEMGRPKFEKAKFELKSGQVLRMEIPLNTIF